MNARWRLLLRVNLDDLQLLPARRLVLADLANGVGLLPVLASSRLRLGDGRHLRNDGVLLLVVVDVVARGEGWAPAPASRPPPPTSCRTRAGEGAARPTGGGPLASVRVLGELPWGRPPSG
jgi:hypothetical protein